MGMDSVSGPPETLDVPVTKQKGTCVDTVQPVSQVNLTCGGSQRPVSQVRT
jgi:hypothetical protein